MIDSTTLSYFDAQKPVVLQVDASMKALGAALSQDGKPVAFASKALSPEESRYANIERELLAVVYGCERFHNYLFGRPFTVESDHKPLASIHLKHLNTSPARLGRMLVRLQPCDLKIVYLPGAEMYIADALSRLSGKDQDEIADLDVTIHEISWQFTLSLLEEIRTATDEDDELRSWKKSSMSAGHSQGQMHSAYCCRIGIFETSCPSTTGKEPGSSSRARFAQDFWCSFILLIKAWRRLDFMHVPPSTGLGFMMTSSRWSRHAVYAKRHCPSNPRSR